MIAIYGAFDGRQKSAWFSRHGNLIFEKLYNFSLLEKTAIRSGQAIIQVSGVGFKFS